MPPKRKATTTTANQRKSKSQATQKKKSTSTRARQSTKARSTASERLSRTPQIPEILEAFRLYAAPRSSVSQDEAEDEDEDEEDDDEMDEEVRAEKRVLRVSDVRRCLKALNLPKPPPDFFDDDDVEEGSLKAGQFVELAQTMAQSEDNGVEGDGGGDVDEEQRAEIDHAFGLFTHSLPLGSEAIKGKSKAPAEGLRITLADLKRVARELREDVDDKTLKLMIAEANGGHASENANWEQGVGRDEFENVMKRAGVFV